MHFSVLQCQASCALTLGHGWTLRGPSEVLVAAPIPHGQSRRAEHFVGRDTPC